MWTQFNWSIYKNHKSTFIFILNCWTVQTDLKCNWSIYENHKITLLIITIVTDIMGCTLSACLMWPQHTKDALHPHFPRQRWGKCLPTNKTFHILALRNCGCSVSTKQPFLWAFWWGLLLLAPLPTLLLQGSFYGGVGEYCCWPATFNEMIVRISLFLYKQENKEKLKTKLCSPLSASSFSLFPRASLWIWPNLFWAEPLSWCA